MLSKIESIAKFLEPKMPFIPKTGIILGTGLGGLIEKIDIKLSLSYQDIPDFPVSTVRVIVANSYLVFCQMCLL